MEALAEIGRRATVEIGVGSSSGEFFLMSFETNDLFLFFFFAEIVMYTVAISSHSFVLIAISNCD